MKTFTRLMAGALLLTTTLVQASEPLRLDRIGIVRFTATGGNFLLRERGILFMNGQVMWRSTLEIPRPDNTPDWILGRHLVSTAAWLAYHALGSAALDNFTPTDGFVLTPLGDETYYSVAPREDAYLAAGRLMNISTLSELVPGKGPVIAGFVIDEHPRAVLIRAVGPGLAAFGIDSFVSDPFLSLKIGNTTHYFNDDWSEDPDAELVRAAALRVGAFPLTEGSKDAARLLVLAPGIYTVHAEPAQSGPDAGGTVLIEVFSVPEDVLWTETEA